MDAQHLRSAAAIAFAAGALLVSPAILNAQADPPERPAAGTSAVEVVAEDYAFDAPDEIPSGWTTLRFKNEGEEAHMVFMSRLPEGKSLHDYETEVSAPFSRAWRAVAEGAADQEEALGMIFEGLPDWFPELQFVGGPGLAAPGEVFEVTLDLEPGNYVLECYVKTEDGEIHYMEGMIRPLRVNEQRSDVPMPEADARITLSNFKMTMEGSLTAGRNTVEVHVAENPEEGFGHNVHVARLEPGTAVDQVVEWMNWLGKDGYRAPAPAHFVGGIHPMPAGSSAYLTVDLEPGRYLLLSEATAARGVLMEVTVP